MNTQTQEQGKTHSKEKWKENFLERETDLSMPQTSQRLVKTPVIYNQQTPASLFTQEVVRVPTFKKPGTWAGKMALWARELGGCQA